MPALVLPIEQGEELFQAETQNEARSFLARFVTFSAETNRRSSSFLRSAPTTTLIQLAKELEGLRQETLSLPAMPKGSYSEVIPALRLDGTSRALTRRIDAHPRAPTPRFHDIPGQPELRRQIGRPSIPCPRVVFVLALVGLPHPGGTGMKKIFLKGAVRRLSCCRRDPPQHRPGGLAGGPPARPCEERYAVP
jgi:hypothetical protein